MSLAATSAQIIVLKGNYLLFVVFGCSTRHTESLSSRDNMSQLYFGGYLVLILARAFSILTRSFVVYLVLILARAFSVMTGFFVVFLMFPCRIVSCHDCPPVFLILVLSSKFTLNNLSTWQVSLNIPSIHILLTEYVWFTGTIWVVLLVVCWYLKMASRTMSCAVWFQVMLDCSRYIVSYILHLNWPYYASLKSVFCHFFYHRYLFLWPWQVHSFHLCGIWSITEGRLNYVLLSTV